MKMLTIRFILGCFLLCCVPCVFAGIKYRQASEVDVNGIVSLYEHFSEDDKNKLLVFPPDMQKEEILKNVRKGRFFVACDKASKQIISFLKLYVVDPRDVGVILTEELCFGLGSPLIDDACYYFPAERVRDFSVPLKRMDMACVETNDLLSPIEKNLICNNQLDSCLYLYHGSAYTHPDYRGHGIYSNLLKYAFYKYHECFFGKKHIALLYGQVNDNVGNVAIVRVFAECLAEVFAQFFPDMPFFAAYPLPFLKNITLQHLSCRAYKPEVNARGEIEIIKDEKHAGRGNMIVYSA